MYRNSIFSRVSQIRIRGSWRSSPALYVILIGRPGQGKTPPLDYAYRPLQEHDFLQVSRFIEENKRYAEQNAGARDGDAFDKNKPVLIRPYFGVGLFGKTDGEDMFGDEGFKRFDFGLGLRAGLEFNNKIPVSIGYDFGVLDVFDEVSAKTRNLTISIGYKF